MSLKNNVVSDEYEKLTALFYVITDMRYVPILQDCQGIITRSVSDPNNDGMVLVTINR